MPNIHAHAVTEADAATFEKDGYWVSPPLLDPEGVEELKRAQHRLWSGDFDTRSRPQHKDHVRAAYEPGVLRQLVNGWWLNDSIRDTVLSGEIGRMAATFLGCERVRLWHDQVILKPPAADAASTAGNVGWHQDCGHWHDVDTTNMVTVWIALQDTDLGNGGMRTIAGSHRWGLLEDSDTFFNPDLDGLKAKFGKNGEGEWRDEPCVIAAGAASFHHGLTLHGSGPNLSDRPRLSVIAHLMPDGTGYAAAEKGHPNALLLGPRLQRGRKWNGPFFPLLGNGAAAS